MWKGTSQAETQDYYVVGGLVGDSFGIYTASGDFLSPSHSMFRKAVYMVDAFA